MLIVLYVILAGLFLFAAFGAWLIRHLMSQRDAIDDRLVNLDRPVQVRKPSDRNWRERMALKPPTLLNDFALPNLAGGITTLSQWRDREILLIYVQSDCPHSRTLLDLIAKRLSDNDESRSSSRIPVVVWFGSADWLHSHVEHRLPPEQTTLHRGTGVAKLHKVAVTPSAYLVDPASVTESPMIRGVDEIMFALETGTYRDRSAQPVASVDATTTPLSLARHEALRPLPSGSMLPTSDLPDNLRARIELDLSAAATRPLLIVDPACPACHHLVASLETSDRTDLPTLINVGNPDDGRSFASSGRWSIIDDPTRALSLAVGTMVTPSALTLDPHGRLSETVAVGLTESTTLLAGAVQPEPGSTRRHRTRPHPSPLDTPLVSTILITRDRPGFLRFAISSFHHQTYPNRELIVVDDGDRAPADPTMIAAAGARLVRVPTGTPIGAKLNAGLEVANGLLCQKMDDDDWYAPRYIETMVNRFQESWRDGCQPTVGFVSPFLFFDVARWEIRRSRDRNVPGATLFFRRADWLLHPFRPLPGDEDLWFFLDQMEAHARSIAIDDPELFLAVRHRGSQQERGHTWVTQMDTRPLEDYLLERPLHARSPEKMLPGWAMSFYQDLRRELHTTELSDPIIERLHD